jgi:predicted nucleic acid-binding protein
MVFVDTWAWLALAFRRDQHHTAALAQHAQFVAAGRQYVTTDFVLTELITQLYRMLPADQAEAFTSALFVAFQSGAYRLERISEQRFELAWQLRRKYADKPTISFVDFTSFAVMQELAIQ